MKQLTYHFDVEKPFAKLAHITKYDYVPVKLASPIAKKTINLIRKSMGGVSVDITNGQLVTERHEVNCDNHKIDIFCYRPKIEGNQSAVLFFHGGGWIGGTVNAVEHFCMALAERANSAVFSVDYRLAPEHPFPAGLEDAYASAQWLFEHSDALSIDKKQIHIAGDSAGGNLATVLCLLACQRAEFTLKSQILLYPVVDVRSNHNDALELATTLYLNGQDLRRDWRVSPIVSEDLANLPRTMIAVGELDNLYASNLAFAKALDWSGVDTTMMTFMNSHHAFIDDTGTNQHGEFLACRIDEWLRQAL